MKFIPFTNILILSIPKDCPDVSVNWSDVNIVLPSLSLEVFGTKDSVQSELKSPPPPLLKKLSVPLAILLRVFLLSSATRTDLGTRSASRLTNITRFSCFIPLGSTSPLTITLLGSMYIRLFWSTLTNIFSLFDKSLFPII